MNVLTLLDGDLDNANVFTLTLILLFVSVFLICIHVSLTVKLRVPVKIDQIKCNSWNQLKTLFLLNFSWAYEETDLTIKQLYQFLLSL